MVECEICMDTFPIDCFEFLPCAHKLCHFCYYNLKKFECPYCRLTLEVPSDDENDIDFDPPIEVNQKKKRRNRRKNNTNESFNINYELNNLNVSLNNNQNNTRNSNRRNLNRRRNNNNNNNENSQRNAERLLDEQWENLVLMS